MRASRSFPFVSKVTGKNFVAEATRRMLGVRQPVVNHSLDLDFVGVKAPMFSFSRLVGADPLLGVEMASTGEVGCFGDDRNEALLHAMLATGFRFPKKGVLLSLGPLLGAQGCASTRYDSIQEIQASLSPGGKVLSVPVVSQQTDSLCGLACLDALLRFNGVALDNRARARFHPETVEANGGITAGEMQTYLQERGFRAVLVHGRLDRSRPTGILGLLEKGLPPVVELVTEELGASFHHYAVVCGFDQSQATQTCGVAPRTGGTAPSRAPFQHHNSGSQAIASQTPAH